MDIGQNWVTALLAANGGTSLAALLKAFWKDFKLGLKFEKMSQQINGVRLEMAAELKTLDTRITGTEQEIDSHALYDAQNYVPRSEFAGVISRLDSKLDAKFEALNSNIIIAIRDGHKNN